MVTVIFSHLSVGQKRPTLLHEAIMETLRPLVDAASANFDADGVGKDV